MMKIFGLILVIVYALLMLFALWRQNSQGNPVGSTPPANDASPMECLPSICIGGGCLLLLAYSLLYILWGRSMMPCLVAGMLGISAGTLQNGIRQKKVHIRHHIIRLIIEAAIAAICWMA